MASKFLITNKLTWALFSRISSNSSVAHKGGEEERRRRGRAGKRGREREEIKEGGEKEKDGWLVDGPLYCTVGYCIAYGYRSG